MPRTTLDLDASVLRELKKRRDREHRPLGVIASELLARSLVEEAVEPRAFAWEARRMGARVDIEDKETLRAALDRDQ